MKSEPFLLVVLYWVGGQLNSVEDELETRGGNVSEGLSFASQGQSQASLGSSLLHPLINDWEEYIFHPEG